MFLRNILTTARRNSFLFSFSLERLTSRSYDFWFEYFKISQNDVFIGRDGLCIRFMENGTWSGNRVPITLRNIAISPLPASFSRFPCADNRAKILATIVGSNGSRIRTSNAIVMYHGGISYVSQFRSIFSSSRGGIENNNRESNEWKKERQKNIYIYFLNQQINPIYITYNLQRVKWIAPWTNVYDSTSEQISSIVSISPDS